MRSTLYFLSLMAMFVSAEVVAQSTGEASQAHGAYDPHRALTPSQHIKVALQHKHEGRMSLAIDTLTQALANYGSDIQLLAVRSSLYLETQQPSAALKDLNTALELDATDPRLLVNRADVYRQFGRTTEALSDLDRAIALNSEMVPAYFNRGTIHYQNGEYQKSLLDFTRCIEIEPHAAGPYFNRASVQDVLGDRDSAIADIKRFMNLTDNESWRKIAQELLDSWQDTDSAEKSGSENNS